MYGGLFCALNVQGMDTIVGTVKCVQKQQPDGEVFLPVNGKKTNQETSAPMMATHNTFLALQTDEGSCEVGELPTLQCDKEIRVVMVGDLVVGVVNGATGQGVTLRSIANLNG